MEKKSIYTQIVSSTLASTIAEVCTVPFDTIKVRQQIQNQTNKYLNIRQNIKNIIKYEGAKSLWKGLEAALLRQICYNSMTMMLYNPMHTFLVNTFDTDNLLIKFLSAGNSGAISIACFNWTDVVKTVIQTNTQSNKSIGSSIKNIYKYAGVAGFFYGLKPNIYRAYIVNGVGLGSYKEIKHQLIPMFGNNNTNYLLSSISSGLLSSIISTPIDVIKTRMMNYNCEGYVSTIHAIKQIWKNEGYKGYFRGMLSICIRRILWASTFFFCYENLYNCE